MHALRLYMRQLINTVQYIQVIQVQYIQVRLQEYKVGMYNTVANVCVACR